MMNILPYKNHILATIVPLLLLLWGCDNSAEKRGAIETDPNKRLEALPRSQNEINTPADALAAIKNGNERYKNGQFQHIHIKRVTAFDSSEAIPFVAVLTCPDFKIPPEILFDIERNEILLIKTAANIEDETTIKRLEDAAAGSHIKLIAVLGHSNCTALKNLVAKKSMAAKTTSTKIDSAIVADATGQPILNETALKNISLVTKRIQSNKLIDSLVKSGNILMQQVYFDEATKRLSFIDR